MNTFSVVVRVQWCCCNIFQFGNFDTMPNTINFSKFIIFIITRNKYSYSPQTVILAELPYYEPLRNFYSHESMKQVFRLFERKKVIINNSN